VAALVLSAPIYGWLQKQYGGVPCLHRMLWTFLLLLLAMAGLTAGKPLAAPPAPASAARDGYAHVARGLCLGHGGHRGGGRILSPLSLAPQRSYFADWVA